jgi:flavorubredoxin
MAVKKIKDNIWYVGFEDWNRQLFDELVHLPDGTSYNSYLIKGSEKTALIDTSDFHTREWYLGALERLLKEENLKIDYVISNHAEQDHSGLIKDVLNLFPEAKIVTNPKCKSFLQELILLEEDNFITVSDGEELSLGDKTLQFIYAPWVHWPETMFTYLKEDGILFTCDFLGSHIATSHLWASRESKDYFAAKRYYAEIMMPFVVHVRKHLKRIEELNPTIIAPSHGPLYKMPSWIMDAYSYWASPEKNNEIIIAYVSMHGSSRKMADIFYNHTTRLGLNPILFNLAQADTGKLSMALVKAASLVIVAPTVLAGVHPHALFAAYFISTLRPELKFTSYVYSYNWGGKTGKQIEEALSPLKAEMLPPLGIKGYPKEEDIAKIEALAEKFAEKHREIGILK